MINIYTGRAGRGQSEAIYKDVLSLPHNEKAFVVVPDQFTYETERRLLEGRSVNLQTEVLSLKRLSYRLENECAKEKINLVSQEADSILIRRATSLVSKELKAFSGVCHTQGFCEDALEFISEMKKADVDISSIDISPDEPESVKEKIGDIKKIYEKYLSLIPEGYIPSDDYFSFIAKCAVNSEIIKNSHFYFDGFYSFDKNEYSLISLIMQNAKSVSFSFITDDEKMFYCSQITLGEIMGMIDEYSLEYKTDTFTDSLLHEEGTFLEENLMGYERVEFLDDTDRISLAVAKKKSDECDYVCSEINRLIRNEGYRYSDFQIIATDKSYFGMMKNILRRHDIEFFIDENREISSTSPVRAFLYIADMLSSSFTTNEVISFAKSGYADVSEDEYMLIENYALEMGIRSSMWEKDFYKNNPEESYDIEKINEIRRKLITPVMNIRDKVSDYENVSDFVLRFSEALEEIRFEENIQENIDGFVKDGDYESANIYSQINNKILMILSSLDEFFGKDELSVREIYELLSFALSSCKVGIIPSRVDAVSIGDVIRSVNKNTKVMFILGCAEGLMPSSDHKKPILTERERNSLSSFSVKNSGDYLRKRENFVYYTYICSPKEKLYLSYSKDEDDVYPGRFFSRIGELFPRSCHIDVSKVLSAQEMVDTKKYSFYRLTDLMPAYESEEMSDREEKELKAMISSLRGEAEEDHLKMIRSGLFFDNDSRIRRKGVYSGVLGSPLVTSVSMLENYGKCPFSFFMNYIIKPKERRLKEIRTTDIGSILHKVIETISRMIISEEVDINTLTDEEISVIAEKAVDDILEKYRGGVFDGITHGKYLHRKLINSSVGAIKELVSQLRRSDFVIHDSETSFGMRDKYDAIKIMTDDEREVLVRGIIDRIDFAELGRGKFVKVIDYKSSKRSFSLSKLNGNISFQLPAYALALRKMGDVAGVFYFRLASPPVEIKAQTNTEALKKKIKAERKLNGLTLKDMDIVLSLDRNAESDSFIGNVSIKKDKTFSEREGLYTKEELDALLRLTQSGMKDVSEDILGGEIPVHPYRYQKTENACTFCEYGGICKFSTSFDKNSYRNIQTVKKDILLKGGE